MAPPAFALSHLVTFRTLVEHGNFTRAAEALNVTQPAVTQHVRALEAHFGVKLVDVSGRRMRLTAAGTYFAEHAQRMLAVAETLERDMRAFADVEAGELRVGATVTIGSYGLAPIVAAFARAHPRITLHVQVANTAEIVAGVLGGALSLALIEGEATDDALDIVPYQDDELVIVAAAAHRFAHGRVVTKPGDLRDENFVAREEGSGTRALFESVLRRAGVVPNVVLTLPTGEGIVQAVGADIGIAALSRLVVRDALTDGRLRAIELTRLDFRRSFKLARLKDVTPSPAARAFAAVALDGAHGRFVDARHRMLERSPEP